MRRLLLILSLVFASSLASGQCLSALGSLVATGSLDAQCGTSSGGGGGGGSIPTTYAAYTGVDVVAFPTPPEFGGPVKNGALWSDPSLPSANPSVVFRCTDQNTYPAGLLYANQSKSVGLGSAGDARWLFNKDSTLMVFNTSGNAQHIVPIDKVALSCGKAITQDHNKTTPGSANAIVNFGSGSFNWVDRQIYIGSGGTLGTPNYVLAKYSIDPVTLDFTVVDASFLDFSYGYPVGNLAPLWQSGHQYDPGDYVSYTLNLDDWSPSKVYVQGDLIKPSTNNPLQCAFKLSTVGVRGSTPTQPAAWTSSTDGSCFNANAQNKSEGGGSTAVWKNIGNDGSFTFQLVGTSGGVSTGFVPAGHPDLGSTVVDAAGLQWKNTGALLAPKWKSFAGISNDERPNRACEAFSSNTYGHPGHYSDDNGGQGTGIYVLCYDSATNKFELLNTLTGIQSETTCSVLTDYKCTGGTQSKLTAKGPAYTALSLVPCFETHGSKGGATLNYVTVPMQCSGHTYYRWKPFADYSDSNLAVWNTANNHYALGDKTLVNLFEPSVFGWTSGVYSLIIDGDYPGTTKVNWQPTPCDEPWAANHPHPPCNPADAYDSHLAMLSWPENMDYGPVYGSVYNFTNLDPTPVAPWQGEEVAVSTSPNWNYGDPVPSEQVVWRFAHCMTSGTNPFFDAQFCISQLSQDGQFLAWTTDDMGKFGDVSRNAVATWGLPWVIGRSYQSGNRVNPFASTSGSGTNYGVWEVVVPGIAATPKPWTTSADVCTDANAATMPNKTDGGGTQYKCIGTADAKSEVVIMNMR